MGVSFNSLTMAIPMDLTGMENLGGTIRYREEAGKAWLLGSWNSR
jgi:hypothetical protein